ncbi:MAG: DNA primase small subunit PriS [Candidatus Thermoplasmatota archaeon]
MTTNAAAAPAPPSQPASKPAPPTEFPPPVKATIHWLNQRFRDWYKANPPPLPDRFTRREFGYIPWPERPGPPPFVRHLGFDSQTTFHESLARSGPHSVYYSTAYYRRPAEMKMLDKQWLGAELIFDLDADHLADVEKAKAEGREFPLDEQLRQVKEKFKTLLDEFLFGDFGLSQKDVWITFSGGRGYHAHVMEERLLQLGSKERREVVDYITGKVPAEKGSETPDISVFLEKVATGADSFRGKVKADFAYKLAPVTAPGWPGRLTRTLMKDLEANVFGQERPAARKWLLSIDGIGGTTADKFLDKVEKLSGPAHGKSVQQLVAEGRIGHRSDPLFKIATKSLEQFGLAQAKGETDEPVTADIKRLIRLPGSLHGKSGLKVVILTRDQLDDFIPLRDAVAFLMDPIKFTARKDQEATLGGERVAVKAGEQAIVPEAHAVFWCARQSGTVTVSR